MSICLIKAYVSGTLQIRSLCFINHLLINYGDGGGCYFSECYIYVKKVKKILALVLYLSTFLCNCLLTHSANFLHGTFFLHDGKCWSNLLCLIFVEWFQWWNVQYFFWWIFWIPLNISPLSPTNICFIPFRVIQQRNTQYR